MTVSVKTLGIDRLGIDERLALVSVFFAIARRAHCVSWTSWSTDLARSDVARMSVPRDLGDWFRRDSGQQWVDL
jgi:hypothetical protein